MSENFSISAAQMTKMYTRVSLIRSGPAECRPGSKLKLVNQRPHQVDANHGERSEPKN